MEIKKSPKADLERGKGLSLLMGFVVGLAVLYHHIHPGSSDIGPSDMYPFLVFQPPQRQPGYYVLRAEESVPGRSVARVLVDDFHILDNDGVEWLDVYLAEIDSGIGSCSDFPDDLL